MREGHDRIAKRLFAHSGVVAETLRSFLPQGLLPGFDATTLRRFPAERVDARLALRRADIAWEFALRDGVRIVLLIEAQSTPDAAMAARMTVQCAMLWEDCQRRGDAVPAIIPLVFYTGRPRWKAVHSLREATECPPGLLAYMPEKCYLLLDAGALSSSQHSGDGRMSLIVRMANAPGSAEAKEVLKAARRRWGEADREFCRDLTLWVYEVLWPTKYKEADRKEVLMNWMEEFPDVVEEIKKDIMELRFEQGIERGAEQATSTLRKEQRAWIGRLATRRFGQRAGESLGEHLANVNSTADFEQVSDWIVDCASEEELLAKIPNGRSAR
ncbi:MAG: Rpn family recombination-promoting nuclease/putative transposase [Gammaproteobacteria bacterium]|nr:Rpn family recombination-promoting nuclease/putative transposase [Gammaproteobacteria bacterium]